MTYEELLEYVELLERALQVAVSDVSAIAGELEHPAAFTPVVTEYHTMLAGQLRRIAAALDATNPPAPSAE
jgi:hypothetical protein